MDYSKWDDLASDSDDDAAPSGPQEDAAGSGGGGGSNSSSTEKAPPTPTRFDFGESQVIPAEVDFNTPEARQRLRGLPLVENEIWQIVTRRLRVWNAAGTSDGDATASSSPSPPSSPIQPYALLLCALYPEGKLLSYTIGAVPQDPPTPFESFSHISSSMLNPSVGAQRRPGKLVCVDASLAGGLYRSLESLGVECTQLSEPSGIDDYVKLISEQLVTKGFAARGQMSERPGLLSDRTLTEPGLTGLFTRAASLLRSDPWTNLPPDDARDLVVKLTLLEPTTVCGEGGVVLSASNTTAEPTWYHAPRPCGTHGVLFGFTQVTR